jgi:hypothetical protein
MIELDNLGGFRKGRLWINSLPELTSKVIKVLTSSVNSENHKWNSKAIALELLLAPREISNYAFLGVKYIPSEDSYLNIEVRVSEYEGALLTDTIALSTDEVHVGIPEEYAETIMATVKDYLKNYGLSSGTLLFDLGAHGHVGSSKIIFSKTTKILMSLLGKNLNDTTVNEYKEMIASELMSPQN